MLGHRLSVDIDLFTDATYGSINFNKIDKKLIQEFPYVEMSSEGNNSIGKTYYIGKQKEESIKVDVFYTDNFIRPIHRIDNIRLSYIEEIVAMKLEVIGNTGRKKDFWDIHELLNYFSIEEMLHFYIERNTYGYTKSEILFKLSDFEESDTGFTPICLKQKYWELIKLDIIAAIKKQK